MHTLQFSTQVGTNCSNCRESVASSNHKQIKSEEFTFRLLRNVAVQRSYGFRLALVLLHLGSRSRYAQTLLVSGAIVGALPSDCPTLPSSSG